MGERKLLANTRFNKYNREPKVYALAMEMVQFSRFFPPILGSCLLGRYNTGKEICCSRIRLIPVDRYIVSYSMFCEVLNWILEPFRSCLLVNYAVSNHRETSGLDAIKVAGAQQNV